MATPVRYHINGATHKAGRCKAAPGNCPLGADAPHFASLREAREEVARQEAERHSVVPIAMKKAPTGVVTPISAAKSFGARAKALAQEASAQESPLDKPMTPAAKEALRAAMLTSARVATMEAEEEAAEAWGAHDREGWRRAYAERLRLRRTERELSQKAPTAPPAEGEEGALRRSYEGEQLQYLQDFCAEEEDALPTSYAPQVRGASEGYMEVRSVAEAEDLTTLSSKASYLQDQAYEASTLANLARRYGQQEEEAHQRARSEALQEGCDRLRESDALVEEFLKA